jgi:Beta-propeller domains of methanol dehydrogenase type
MIMICTLFLLPACLLFPLGAYAESQNTILWENPDTGYCIILEDDAQLLGSREQEELAAAMRTVTAYGNAAFKSISANSYSAASFADDYYHGLFGTESGTLFLIDMDNRELYLFSDGAIYRTIGKSYADTITDNVYRYASNGDYYLCASSAFEQIGAVLAGEKIAQPMKYISNALLAFILAALLNYFLARSLSRSSKPGTGEILGSISTRFDFRNPRKILTSQTKVYDPPSSSSSGGSGGGHSGGGGGGGHSSGGGGGHRF